MLTNIFKTHTVYFSEEFEIVDTYGKLVQPV